MEFGKGTVIYTADNKELGTIERVVLNPETDKVTHVIVRKGFLFTEDKVVPIELIDTSREDRVFLRHTADDLPHLVNFEERHYLTPEGIPGYAGNRAEPSVPSTAAGAYARPAYWYPPAGTAWWGYTAAPYPGQPAGTYETTVERNIPDDTVALKEGADVISADDEHVGDVERVFFDTESKRATHFVISQGLLFKERKLVPTMWVDTVGEEEVWLRVNSDFLNRLPPYNE